VLQGLHLYEVLIINTSAKATTVIKMAMTLTNPPKCQIILELSHKFFDFALGSRASDIQKLFVYPPK
jgi:hypothetical protein